MTEIMNNADACTEEAARRAVYSLTDKGLLIRVNEGAKGTPAIYAITAKAKGLSCEN